MGGKHRILTPLLAAAVCVAYAVARGRLEMIIIIVQAVAAMCIASVLMGFVLRRRWQMTLWCMWLATFEGWLLLVTLDFDKGCAYVWNQLACCDLVTMCSLVLLAMSLVLVKPCHELGAWLRNLPAAHLRAADIGAGQLV